MCKTDISGSLRRDALAIQKEQGTLAAAAFMRSWYFSLKATLETLTGRQPKGE